jgi:hypothetical protein
VKAISKVLRDAVKWALFELGAGYYARKLAVGPDADLRRPPQRAILSFRAFSMSVVGPGT